MFANVLINIIYKYISGIRYRVSGIFIQHGEPLAIDYSKWHPQRKGRIQKKSEIS